MASGTPSAQVPIPVGDLVFPAPTYAHTTLLGGRIIRRLKKYTAAEILSGGGKIIRAGAGGPEIRRKTFEISQSRKLSHTAKNTLFHVLIHCETNPYPYTLPKTSS